mmetsp:Transcript_17137/g.55686  ORF Transcript_17137/g.55686 Transcript_17137/m.55686 type:complete len:133 (-) Transcript_17137:707-1105(-)
MYLPPREGRRVLKTILGAFPRATVAFDYLGNCGREDLKADPAAVMFMTTVSTLDDWLWPGSWDQQAAKADCGDYAIVEDLGLPELLTLARGQQVADAIYRDFPQLTKSKLYGTYRFCLVRNADDDDDAKKDP